MTSRQALIHEFNSSIAEQKLALEQQLPNLWRQCYGSAPLAQQPAPALPAKSGGGLKRASTAAAPSAKAVRRGAAEDLDPRVELMLKECLNIINKRLWGHKAAMWFRAPVDAVKNNVPNYSLFVKHPMDLGTIKTRLMTRYYRSPLDVRDDVNLVWDNCCAYNLEGSTARNDGETCRGIWKRAWQETQIEAQYLLMQKEQQEPVETPPHERASALSSQLSKAVEALPSVSRQDGPRLEMSFAEKRRLSQQLSRMQLSAEKLQGVLEIVSKDPRVSMAADVDLELDIDALKSDTLWKLQELVEWPAGRPAAQSKPLSARPTPAAPAPAPASVAEKRPPPHVTNSVQSSGASDSDSGEVKGSTMDEIERPAFVRPGREAGNLVDESATNPKEPSLFIKDRGAARKPDVNINTADWSALTTVQDAAEAQPEAGGDDVWKSFQSMAEQKQQREEMVRQEAEQAEKQRREEQERQKREEEERHRKLKEEEERQQAEMLKQREEQRQKELAEIQAKAGTANLAQQSDVAILANMPAPAADALASVGLAFEDDDADMNFEDD